MRIFLSVSFSSQVDSNGVVNPAYRSDLEVLIQKLEEERHEIYCAPRAEGWKINNNDPVKLLKTELNEIDNSEVLVAILDQEISAGVQLSIGYALAQEKRMVLASPIGVKHGWANSALSGFDKISNVNFEFYDELAQQILELTTR